MNHPPSISWVTRLRNVILSVGPGIFCIGYTVGTGSVTTLSKAGADVGMSLLWLLALCCLFMGVLMEAFGRYAAVTGDTAIHGFRKNLAGGPGIAVFVIAGVLLAQYGAIMGITGLCSSMITEVLELNVELAGISTYALRLIVAVVIVVTLYAILLVGRYSFFEKVLVFFVALMSLGFIVSTFVVLPAPLVWARGMVPSLPANPDHFVLVPALVGTTMAAATFVVRPLLVKTKGWGIAERREQTRDSVIGALLMFVVGGAIMASATGAMHASGHTVNHVMDMVRALQPAAGQFATVLFFIGVLSAGLSSLIPIMMVAPLLIADYRDGRMETDTRLFRILAAVTCVMGLTVPVLGVNPIQAQIVTQIAGVFVLPLSIGAMIYLVNRKDLMGAHRPGWAMNAGMAAAFLFSILIMYSGILAVAEKLKG